MYKRSVFHCSKTLRWTKNSASAARIFSAVGPNLPTDLASMVEVEPSQFHYKKSRFWWKLFAKVALGVKIDEILEEGKDVAVAVTTSNQTHVDSDAHRYLHWVSADTGDWYNSIGKKLNAKAYFQNDQCLIKW